MPLSRTHVLGPSAVATATLPLAATPPSAQPDSVGVAWILAAVLRPTLPSGTLATYERDEAPGTVHAAAFRGTGTVGAATVYAEAPPESRRGEIPAWAFAPGAAFRLRGMATDLDARGSGLGRALLDACLDHVRARGASVLWCDARVGAVGF